MSTGKDLFPLTVAGELRVELEVVREGREFSLIHVFREPNVDDRKAFWGFLGHSELLAKNAGKGPIIWAPRTCCMIAVFSESRDMNFRRMPARTGNPWCRSSTRPGP